MNQEYHQQTNPDTAHFDVARLLSAYLKMREAVEKIKSQVDEHYCRPDSDIRGCKLCDIHYELENALNFVPEGV